MTTQTDLIAANQKRGWVVVRAKGDRSGFERVSGGDLPAAFEGLKPTASPTRCPAV
ncbi:MAG: hypothetical protein JWM33_4015 [Caulobacteraceae bacterium]|nr:hypothetical protein [Caulobacteraceae bacterium]